MPPFIVEFTRSAAKEFSRLPRSVQERFARAFERLTASPHGRAAGVDVRRLRGPVPAWRLRVGEYRGIYAVEESRIVFTRFGHRSSVYGV